MGRRPLFLDIEVHPRDSATRFFDLEVHRKGSATGFFRPRGPTEGVSDPFSRRRMPSEGVVDRPGCTSRSEFTLKLLAGRRRRALPLSVHCPGLGGCSLPRGPLTPPGPSAGRAACAVQAQRWSSAGRGLRDTVVTASGAGLSGRLLAPAGPAYSARPRCRPGCVRGSGSEVVLSRPRSQGHGADCERCGLFREAARSRAARLLRPAQVPAGLRARFRLIYAHRCSLNRARRGSRHFAGPVVSGPRGSEQPHAAATPITQRSGPTSPTSLPCSSMTYLHAASTARAVSRLLTLPPRDHTFRAGMARLATPVVDATTCTWLVRTWRA